MSRCNLGYGAGIIVSLAVHVSVAWLLVRVAPDTPPTSLRPAAPIEIEVYDGQGSTGPGAGGKQPHRVPGTLLAGSRDTRQSLDTSGENGRGGDGRSRAGIVRLMGRVDPVLLEDSPANATDVSQVQRIRTGKDRQSPEDRRATPHPDDDHFLASGKGRHRVRRKPAEQDAQRGAPHDRAPSRRSAAARRRARGDARRLPRLEEGMPMALASKVVAARRAESARTDVPARGIYRGKGSKDSRAAAVATGRPPVDRGPAATLTPETGARPADNRDSEQLVASARQSRTRASPQAAELDAPGVGGKRGRSELAANGSGRGQGARGRAHAPGSGRHGALDTGSPRYLHWFLQQRNRVANVLVYPKERALRMDQGTSVFRLWIGRDGRLVQPPRLIRSSGFEDLDAAALSAIRQSTPFHPMPSQLAPSRARISVLMPIEFVNPMVH